MIRCLLFLFLASFARADDVAEVVKKAGPSTVQVKVPRPGLKDLIGAGVVVRESGLIVTARHIIAASSSVNVVMWDESTLPGRVVWQDADTDLAIVQVEGWHQALRPNLVGLQRGEAVITIGHPFGYTNSVCTGVVSALDREVRLPTGDILKGIIQISAPINPGNSGGPLLNSKGELIGLCVAIRSDAQGIAFAVNATEVEKAVSAGRKLTEPDYKAAREHLRKLMQMFADKFHTRR